MRFKNYDDNYREITLKDVCTLITKGTTPAKFSTNGINFIKIDSLNGNYVDNSKVTHINESIHNTLLSRSILEENDILLAIAGATVGKHCIIQKSNLPANTNQALAIIRLNKHLLPYYLLAFFDTNYLPSYIKLICAASAQPNLNLQQVGQIKLNIPTIQEQEKVCHFIQLLDKRISVQNKIISDLKVLKKELCNRYFKSAHNDTSLEYVTLKDILTERKEYCSKDGTYTHGTLSKEGVFQKTERYDRDFLVKNEDKQYKVTHFNDICYNPANLKFGVICRNTYGDLIFSPIYVTFEIADTVYPAYIELFLTNANFIDRIRRFEQGTVYERMAVSPEDFLSYETRIPTYEEQVKFADKIQRIQDKIELETLFLNSLQKQRKYLLNAMFI